ncbi:MAG: hypothetical protein Q8O09_04795 [Bacillota bacterium]|nr:hypothetical protein [Bacillota bacterium]
MITAAFVLGIVACAYMVFGWWVYAAIMGGVIALIGIIFVIIKQNELKGAEDKPEGQKKMLTAAMVLNIVGFSLNALIVAMTYLPQYIGGMPSSCIPYI